MKWFKSFRSRPANYVLWRDTRFNDGFWVSKRIGVKLDYENRAHFVSFFTNESDAWSAAIQRTKQQIEFLERNIKRFEKERKKSRGV